MRSKKITICLLALLFSILTFSFVFSATANVSCDASNYGYPWCKSNGELGGSGGLINTIYNYSLALVGVAALGAIIYGGIMYTVSAGNPSKQSDAVAWITGAIWGIVLLLGASLLLRTINPQIVNLEFPPIKSITVEAPPSSSSLDPYVTSTIVNGVKVYSIDYKDKMCPSKKDQSSCEGVTENGVAKCQWIPSDVAKINLNQNASQGTNYLTTGGTCGAR